MAKDKVTQEDLKKPMKVYNTNFPKIGDLAAWMETASQASKDEMEKEFFTRALLQYKSQAEGDAASFLLHVCELLNIPERRHAMTWALIVSFYDRMLTHQATSPSLVQALCDKQEALTQVVKERMERNFGISFKDPFKGVTLREMLSQEYLDNLQKEVFNIEFVDSGADEHVESLEGGTAAGSQPSIG